MTDMDLPSVLHQIKCVARVAFVVTNNLYCIPTYLVWTWLFLSPLWWFHPTFYWHIEGILFKWLLCMVASWSWGAEYVVHEVGEDVSSCFDDRCAVVVNHQSTADVPMLMHAFEAKGLLSRHVMWIMDRLFRYTNFGLVSMTHGDFFISQGKDVRDSELDRLRRHLLRVSVPRKHKWIVLFPEGGFLHKRLETSQRYAKKNNFPLLEHVTLPRMGALHIVLNSLVAPKPQSNMKHPPQEGLPDNDPLKWVIDVTIAYPEKSNPLDLLAIASGSRPPCVTYMHYRRYPVESIPYEDMDQLRDWLYKRWQEKEEMLDEYYRTGHFPARPKSLVDSPEYPVNGEIRTTPLKVELDNFWIGCLHVFFICSSYFHLRLFYWLCGLIF